MMMTVQFFSIAVAPIFNFKVFLFPLHSNGAVTLLLTYKICCIYKSVIYESITFYVIVPSSHFYFIFCICLPCLPIWQCHIKVHSAMNRAWNGSILLINYFMIRAISI